MEYYEILGLSQEPFSDTANPFFLYASDEHQDCLHRLEISVRLGRGLNLIMGDVGTGKTTLAMALEHALLQDPTFQLGAIYDPAFLTDEEFLDYILFVMGMSPGKGLTFHQKREAFKEYLLKNIEEGKTFVLIIDEGQKISDSNMETLRTFLNFQTPKMRLLNMVVFSQLEILEEIEKNSGFKERINLLYILKPLTRDDTHRMINFRLAKAGLEEGKSLFSAAAIDVIYHFTQGYPRKIILLCQEAIEELIVLGKHEVDDEMMEAIIRRRKDMEIIIEDYREKLERERLAEREEEASGEEGWRSGVWSLERDDAEGFDEDETPDSPGGEREKSEGTRKKKGIFGWLFHR